MDGGRLGVAARLFLEIGQRLRDDAGRQGVFVEEGDDLRILRRELRGDRLRQLHRRIGDRLLRVAHRLLAALLERRDVLHHRVPVGLVPGGLLELDKVELAQERRRRPVVGQHGLLLDVGALDGRRQRPARTRPEIGVVLLQSVGAELHRVDDFTIPARNAVHEPALGGLLGILEEMLVFREIEHRPEARVRLLDEARDIPALRAVRRVDAQTLDLLAFQGGVVLILEVLVPELHDQIVLALVVRSHDRHGTAVSHLDLAAVAVPQDEGGHLVVEVGAVPVEVADVNLAGGFRLAGRGEGRRRDEGGESGDRKNPELHGFESHGWSPVIAPRGAVKNGRIFSSIVSHHTRAGAKRKPPRLRAGAAQAEASAASTFLATSAGTHFFQTLLVLRKWMAVALASPPASLSR